MIGDLAAGSIPGTKVLELEPQLPGLSNELTTRSLERLTTVATDDALLAAFNEAALDQELWRAALGGLDGFLSSRAVQLPDGVQVTFADRAPKPWLPPTLTSIWWWSHLLDLLPGT
jgi:hypothetical protein